MGLLRKITDLVDKDVAEHSKPVSLILCAVPFLPFMLFIDGAPADHYPLLASAAFAASICWIVFVLWRALRHTRGKLERLGYVIGSAQFWRLVLTTIALVAAASAMLMVFRS